MAMAVKCLLMCSRVKLSAANSGKTSDDEMGWKKTHPKSVLVGIPFIFNSGSSAGVTGDERRRLHQCKLPLRGNN